MGNPYKLDAEMSAEADNIVYQINVRYNIDDDIMQTHVLERNDIESEEFKTRVAHNVESALRRYCTTYGEEMQLIEELARVVED